MTITDSLFYRSDLTAQQKWLLAVLKHLSTSDGSLSITLYQLERNINLIGSNVAHNCVVLTLAHMIELDITHTSDGDLYDMQIAAHRREAAVLV
jgi:hypothetical protein